MLSFVVHELGHIVVAVLLRVPLRKFVLTAFGGQLTFMPTSDKKHLLIAVGGPLFTLLLCIVAAIYDWHALWKIQLVILFVNGLPIWPLDGGKIIYYCVQLKIHRGNFYEHFLSWSIALATILVIISVVLSLPLFMIFIFSMIFLEVLSQFRFRKYFQALQKVY